MCGFRFNRGINGRSITAHTLLELKDHLRKRGIELDFNFKVRAEEYLSHTVIVCEICYSLAIAEYQLKIGRAHV